PLASGLLTGKYQHGAALPPGSRLARNPRHAQEVISEHNWRIIDELTAFVDRRGRSLLELAFSSLLHDAAVARAIAGPTSRRHAAVAGRPGCRRRGLAAFGRGFGRDRPDHAVAREIIGACPVASESELALWSGQRSGRAHWLMLEDEAGCRTVGENAPVFARQ